MKTLLFLALFLALGPAQAEIYKCTGPDGKLVYAQSPCGPAAQAVDVKVKEPNPREVAATKTRDRLDRYGTPKSVYYGSGGYESRTYHVGDSILTVQLRNGVIIDESLFVTNK